MKTYQMERNQVKSRSSLASVTIEMDGLAAVVALPSFNISDCWMG